jgi:glycosyltransferase involved in cell wall biosynthesis
MCFALGLVGAIRVLRVGIDDLAPLLASATIAVNPRPRAEGQPLKLLNYMCAGAPIVSCRGSSPGLRHDENAWLVDDGPGPLAEGLSRLLKEPERAERLGAAARRSGRALPSWRDVAGRLGEIYADLRRVAERDSRSAPGRADRAEPRAQAKLRAHGEVPP